MPNFNSTCFTMLSTQPLVTALGVAFVVLFAGCEATEQAIDDIDSRVQCRKYCMKVESCGDDSSNLDECVSDCRSSIEDECGNEHQADANDKIDECTDKGCTDFYACMVFEAAPECFSFST